MLEYFARIVDRPTAELLMHLKSRWQFLFLWLLVLFAGIALWRGLNGDCPVCSEADEYAYAPRAIYMVLANTLNPGWFANPASTLLYPLEAYYKLVQWCTNEAVLNPSITPEQICAQNMALLVKWPRLISVAATLATIPLIFIVGQRWLGTAPAMLGTVFYGLSPLVIRHGQMLRTDPLANFFVYLFFMILTRFLVTPIKSRLAFGAGVALGLALSTRYFGLALALPFFATLIVLIIQKTDKQERVKMAWSGLVFTLSATLTFIVSSPYVFLDSKTALQDLSFEQNSNFVGVATNDLFGNLSFYIFDALPISIGPFLAVLSLIGLLAVLLRRDRLNWALLLYLFTYAAGVCVNHRHWNRWLLPILPIICLLAGFAITFILRVGHNYLFKRIGRRPDKRELLIASLVLLIALSYPIRRLGAYDWQKRQLSPQARGYFYIRDHIATGSKIALDGAWDYPEREKYQLTTDIWRPDFVPPRKHNYFKPADLTTAGFQYMIVETWLRQFYQQSASQYPRESSFYTALSKEAPLLFTSERKARDNVFGIELEDRKTPVEIYDLSKLKQSPIAPLKN